MNMIGPLPVSPAAPTPWSFDKWNHAVRDARGRYLFEIDGEELDPDEDAALARELVDLVNRAAAVDPETPTVCLPATVETYNGVVWFEVNRQSPPGFAEIRVIDGFGETVCVFDPASTRTLAYALLSAAGPSPVEGPAEPERIGFQVAVEPRKTRKGWPR